MKPDTLTNCLPSSLFVNVGPSSIVYKKRAYTMPSSEIAAAAAACMLG